MKAVDVFYQVGSPKKYRVVWSSLALSDPADSGIYLSKMLSELLFYGTYCIPIEVVNDGKSLYDALHSKKNVLEKYQQIDIALLKKFIEKLRIKTHHVPSKNQLANVLTKKGVSSKEFLDPLSKGVLPI